MTNISSEKQIINKPPDTIYNFLINFNNFKEMLPEQVSDWKADSESCSFTINGMAQITLKIAEKIPYSKIVYKSGADTPIDFNLTFNFETSDSATTASVISFSGNLNSMLKMMLTNPLQKFVNILNQKLKEFFNKN